MERAKCKHDWAIAAHIEAHLLNAWKMKGPPIQPYQLNPIERRRIARRGMSVKECGLLIVGTLPPWQQAEKN